MANVCRARRSVAGTVIRPPLRVVPFDGQWQLRHFFGVWSLPLPRSRIGLVGTNTAGLLY
jgi:hypothetical protein